MRKDLSFKQKETRRIICCDRLVRIDDNPDFISNVASSDDDGFVDTIPKQNIKIRNGTLQPLLNSIR